MKTHNFNYEHPKFTWQTLQSLSLPQILDLNMSDWKLLSCVWLFVTPWTIQSMDFTRLEYWSGNPFPSPRDLPDPGIEPRSPTLQVDSLPAEPHGKPNRTGVGILSLLQLIFPTQEPNWGFLHCWQILYQLSYQGSPSKNIVFQVGESDQLHQTFLLAWENQHQRPGNWVSSVEERGQIPPDMAQERVSSKNN